MKVLSKIFPLCILFFLVSTQMKGQDTLSLDDALQIGLKNNFSVIVARNDLQIATNNNSIGNAGMLPKIDASIGQSNQFQSINQTLADSSKISSDKNTSTQSAAIQLNWTLFDGLNMFVLKDQLGNLQQMGDLKLRMAVEDAAASIIVTYYGIALQQKALKSLKESFSLSKERLSVAREKSRIGAGYELQVTQAEIDFQSDSSSLLRQVNLIKNQMITLNRLLGRDAKTQYSIKEIEPKFVKPDYAAINDGLNNQNAELLYERLNVSNKELSIKSMKSGRYPRVALTSAYNFSQSNYSSGSLDDYRVSGPSVGITASITLFNGMNISRSIKNAQIQAESQKILLSQTENLLQSSLLQYINDLELALALIKTEETTSMLAAKNLSVAMEKYRLGAISDLELRDYQKKMLDAQYRFYSAQLQAKTAEVDLKILAGLLLNDLNTVKP